MINFFPQFRTFRREEQPAQGTAEPTAQKGEEQTKGADYEPHITHAYGQSSLLVPAWFRGVTLIMQTMGQMEVQYQRVNREGGNFYEDDYGPNRQLNYLLQVRPNPLMTGAQLLEQIEYHKIYYGNAYVYIERDPFTGAPQAFWLGTSGAYSIADDTYTITYNAPGGARTVRTSSENVLHFKNVIFYQDTYLGMPTIRFAERALSISATADMQTLKDMAKGGKHQIIIQEKDQPNTNLGFSGAGRINNEEGKRVAEQFNYDLMSKDAIFLSNVMDTKIISQTAAELRTLENRGFQVSDIARLLGVPTIMLMLDSGNNYKTPEAATQEFLLRTIQPRIREMEDEFNSKLLGPDDFRRRRIHICELALRRLDPKQQANLDKIHLETGAMTVNEIRQQYDMPSVDNGDSIYISTNLAELGSDKLRSNGGGGQPGDGGSQSQSKSNDPNAEPEPSGDEEGGEE